MIVCRLQEVLQARHMSRRTLARCTGLTVTTVCKLAQGTHQRLDLETLERVCAALQVQPGELFVWVAEDQTAEESAEWWAMGTVMPT